ncbi:MAG: hypothetical protein ABI977_02175 [Acidobacteriota bacterium]
MRGTQAVTAGAIPQPETDRLTFRSWHFTRAALADCPYSGKAIRVLLPLMALIGRLNAVVRKLNKGKFHETIYEKTSTSNVVVGADDCRSQQYFSTECLLKRSGRQKVKLDVVNRMDKPFTVNFVDNNCKEGRSNQQVAPGTTFNGSAL